MKNYIWHGIDDAGTLINGEKTAANIAVLKHELIKQNISPLKISQKFNLNLLTKKISAKQIADFSRQLSTLINAGIPLLSSLNIIERSAEQKNIPTLINKIKQDIESGLPLSEALKNTNYFDALFCNLIYIGEQSGTLDIMLKHIANYQEKNAAMKRKIKKALFYPAAILGTAIIVTSLLLIFVIPQFAQLFHGFGAELPIYTQFIIKLANYLKKYSLFILLGIIGIIIVGKIAKKRYLGFAKLLDKIILHLPIIGQIVKKAIIARLCHTLAITFKAGLPLSEALQIITQTCDNKVYQEVLIIMQDQVAAGQTISSVMQNNPLFPFRTIQMITIGEESGSLDTMLIKIAEIYESEVNFITDNLNNLLEPAIMIILGILIGGLIIGMYLPIFKLGSVI
jgi:type IV pilus assembly protein PilC